jgi:hypothetical protein
VLVAYHDASLPPDPSTPGTPAPVVLNVATGLVILFGGAAPLLEVRLV